MSEPARAGDRACERCGRMPRQHGYLIGWELVCRPCWLDAFEHDEQVRQHDS